MADLAQLAIVVKSDSVPIAITQLDKLRDTGAKVDTQMDRITVSAQKASSSVDRLAGVTRLLTAAFGAYLGLEGARRVAEMADTWTRLEGRLRLVTQSTQELKTVQQALFKTSQDTRASFESTVQLYSRMAQFGKELGATQGQLLAITKAVQQATKLSGASFAEAASTVTQFSQALASGRLQGDEFRSLMENNPRLMKAIADGMNLPIGQLKALATQGQLTADKISKALLSQKEVLDKEFGTMPKTIGDALQDLSNNFLKFIGEMNNSLGISRGLAQAIGLLADNLGTLATALGVVATLYAGKLLASIVTSTAAFINETRAIVAKNVALAQTAAAASASAAAETAAAAAVSAGYLHMAEASTVAAGAQLRMTTAMQASTAAQAAATAGAVGYTTVLGRLALAARGLGASLLAAFGGPVGVAIAAVAAGIYLMSTHMTEAERVAQGTTKVLEEQRVVLMKLQTAQGEEARALKESKEQMRANTVEVIRNTEAQIERLKVLAESQEVLQVGDLRSGGGVEINPTWDLATQQIEKLTERLNGMKSQLAQMDEQEKTFTQTNTALGHSFEDTSTKVKKLSDELQDEIRHQQMLNAVVSQSGVHNRDYLNSLKAQNEALSQGVPLNSELYSMIENEIKSRDELEQKIRQTEIQIIAENEVKRAGLDLGSKKAKQLMEEVKQREQLKDVYDTQIAVQDELDRQNSEQVKKQVEAYKKALDEQKRIMDQFKENIQNAMADGFEKVIKNLDSFSDAWKSIWSSMKDFAIRMLAEIAAQKVMMTFVGGSVSGGGGGLAGSAANLLSMGSSAKSLIGGMGSDTIGSAATSGGGGIMSNLNLMSGLKSAASFVGGGSTFAGGFGAVNQFGASYLGTGLPGMAGSATSMGLTGILGSAGIGGLIGSLNLFGGNKMGSSIGGTLGGVGGSMLAGSLAGTAAGTAGGAAAGAMAGSVVPVVGTIIGAVLGSLLGGMIGGKPVAASEFAGTIQNQSLTNVGYGSKGMTTDGAKQLASNLGNFVSSIRNLGINVADSNVRGGINSKQGNKYTIVDANGVEGKSFGFDPKNAESMASAMAKLSIELAKTANTSNASLTSALQHIQTEGRKTEDILADLAFAANFDDLKSVVQQTNEFQQAALKLRDSFIQAEDKVNRLGLSMAKMKEYESRDIENFFQTIFTGGPKLADFTVATGKLSASLEDAKKAAEILGYSLEKVNVLYKQQKEAITKAFNDNIDQQILAIVDPATAGLQALNAEFDKIRANAIFVGGDLEKVSQLYRVRLLQLQIQDQKSLASTYQQTRDKMRGFADSLAKLKDSLLVDKTFSPLSPEERYREAKRQFDAVAAPAQLGDTQAIEKLPDLSKSLLEASKDYFGTFGGYLQDFQYVQQILTNTQDLASRHASIAEQNLSAVTQQLEMSQKQLEALQGIKDSIEKMSQANLNAKNVNPKLLTDKALLGAGEAMSKLDQTHFATGLTVRQNRLLARNAGYTGNFDSGVWATFARSHPDVAAEYNRLVIAAGGKPMQFANGGYTPAYGSFLVGERGPELLNLGGRSAHVTSNSELRQGVAASNDNLASAVRELIAEVRSNTQTTANGTRLLHEELSGIRQQATETNSNIQMANYRK